MGLIFLPSYVSKNTKSSKNFRIKIFYSSDDEFKTSIKALGFMLNKSFVAPKKDENGKVKANSGNYYRVPFSLDTYIYIKTIQKYFPDLQIRIASDFTLEYNKFESDCVPEYNLRTNEFKKMMLLQKEVEAKRGVVINKYVFPESSPSLYKHQTVFFALSILLRKSAFFGDVGVGKTAPALHAIRYKLQQGLIKKCVIVVPNSLKYKWALGKKNEISKHTPDLKPLVLDGNKTERLRTIDAFKRGDYNILITSYSFWSGRTDKYILNHLGQEVKLDKSLPYDEADIIYKNKNDDEYTALTECGIDMYVCDESHRLKNPDSSVTRSILTHLSDIKYGIIMTGTPMPNKLVDIFSQFNLLDSSVFSKNYYAFFNHFFTKIINNEEVSYPVFKDENLQREYVAKVKQKAIVYKAKDCIELPQQIHDEIFIKATAEYYNHLEEVLSNFDETQSITDMSYIEENAHIMKLITSCSGFVYDENKNPIRFQNNPKEDVVMEYLEDVVVNQGEKVIIWHNFTFDKVIISEILTKLKIPFIVIDKSDSPLDRVNKIAEYEDSTTLKVLVSNTTLIAEGHDILTAGRSLYYNLTFKFDPINQTEGRNCRFGSIKHHKRIIYTRLVMEDSVEELILSALDRKLTYKELIYGTLGYIKEMKRKLLTGKGRIKTVCQKENSGCQTTM